MSLRPGTYYVWDPVSTLGSGKAPVLTTLRVRQTGSFRPLRGSVHVAATSADRFIAPRAWPHAGRYLFANVADTIHFMQIIPAKRGTTDKEIQTTSSHPAGPSRPRTACPGAPTC